MHMFKSSVWVFPYLSIVTRSMSKGYLPIVAKDYNFPINVWKVIALCIVPVVPMCIRPLRTLDEHHL